MANKNIVFNEDGNTTSLNNTSKIKTHLADGGTCYWVPEQDTNLTTINIEKDGIYRASEQGYYGYSEVNANGSGTSITGDAINKEIEINQNGSYAYAAYDEGHQGYSQVKLLVNITDESNTKYDPYSGNETNTRIDPITGIKTATTLPSYIKVETLPNQTEYIYGSSIDYTGIEVYAYTNTGEVWQNDDYPNGRIPFDELILPTQEAGSGMDGSSVSPNKIMYSYKYGDKIDFIPIITNEYEDDNVKMTVTGNDINNGVCFIAIFLKNNGHDGGFIVKTYKTRYRIDRDPPDCIVTIIDKASSNPDDPEPTYSESILNVTSWYVPEMPAFEGGMGIRYGVYVLKPTSTVYKGEWNNYDQNNELSYGEAAWVTYAYNSDYINNATTLENEKMKNTSYYTVDDFIYKYDFQNYNGRTLYYEVEVSFKQNSYYSDKYNAAENSNKMVVFAASHPNVSSVPFSVIIYAMNQDHLNDDSWWPYIYERRYIDESNIITDVFLPNDRDYHGQNTNYEISRGFERSKMEARGVIDSTHSITLKTGKTIYYKHFNIIHRGLLSESSIHLTHIDGALNYIDYDDLTGIVTEKWIELIAALLYDSEDIQTTVVPRQTEDQSGEQGDDSGEGSEGGSDPSTLPTTTQMIRVGWKRPKDDKQLNTTFPITVTARIDEGWEEP